MDSVNPSQAFILGYYQRAREAFDQAGGPAEFNETVDTFQAHALKPEKGYRETGVQETGTVVAGHVNEDPERPNFLLVDTRLVSNFEADLPEGQLEKVEATAHSHMSFGEYHINGHHLVLVGKQTEGTHVTNAPGIENAEQAVAPEFMLTLADADTGEVVHKIPVRLDREIRHGGQSIVANYEMLKDAIRTAPREYVTVGPGGAVTVSDRIDAIDVLKKYSPFGPIPEGASVSNDIVHGRLSDDHNILCSQAVLVWDGGRGPRERSDPGTQVIVTRYTFEEFQHGDRKILQLNMLSRASTFEDNTEKPAPDRLRSIFFDHTTGAILAQHDL